MLLALCASSAVGCSTVRPLDEGRRCPTEAACATVHPPGIADPNSPDFHVNLIRALAFDLSKCQHCHGDDFAGGTAQKSCLGCHEQGVTACTTCHGQPPETGAHLAHGKRFDCTACHVKPMVYTDVGHLFAEDGTVIDKPRITFGELANASLHAGDRAAPAAIEDDSCKNVYCHGDTFHDGNAKLTQPDWSGGSASAACGTCHGIPPSSHTRTNCAECHPKVADSNYNLVAGGPHVDGKVSLGDESGTCLACHPKLSGAHTAHTSAPHRLRPPLACTECHVVPAEVTSPGHIDHTTPQVFPAGWSGIAAAGGAMPAFDPPNGTCSNVYCHGVANVPSWNGDESAAVCGACHGIPPADSAHATSKGLGDCYKCHPSTIDATGSLIVGATSTHLNGVVDGP
jgi:predicted CxxxxCH...CXXCH cytochrome family protein